MATDTQKFGGLPRMRWMRKRGCFSEAEIKSTLDSIDGPGGYERAMSAMRAESSNLPPEARPAGSVLREFASMGKPAPGHAPKAAAKPAAKPANAQARSDRLVELHREYQALLKPDPKAAAKPKPNTPPKVPGTATGRAIIAPLRAMGASAEFREVAVESGVTLAVAITAARAKSPQALLEVADRHGLSRHQVAAMAQANGVALSPRDFVHVRETPRWRDPARAWDANTTEAAQRCRAFFGESGKDGFLHWAAAEERAGRDWTECAKDLRPKGGW